MNLQGLYNRVRELLSYHDVARERFLDKTYSSQPDYSECIVKNILKLSKNDFNQIIQELEKSELKE